MGSERKQTVKVRKWKAQKGQEVRFFTSRAEALGWLGTRGVPTPFSIAVEDYELCHEHRPRENEDEQDLDNWTGVRLYEKVFALYGTEKPGEPISQVEDRLRTEASARRRTSYRWRRNFLTLENMRAQSPADFPQTALRTALEVKEEESAILDRVATSRENHERRKALPTVKQLHEKAVAEDRRVGRLSAGTADNAAYVAAPWLQVVGDKKVFDVRASDFELWLRGELGSGSKERLRNAVSEIRRCWRYCTRTPSPGEPDLQEFAPAFRVDRLQEDLKGVVMEGGRAQRDVLTPEEVERLIAACETDMERAALALGLLGVRTLGEACGARWSDFGEELGSRWLQVSQTAVDLVGGRVVLESPKDVKSRKRKDSMTYRHYPVTARLWAMLEPLRARGECYVLGGFDVLQTDEESCVPNPKRLGNQVLKPLFVRAGLTRKGLSAYSLRHTVMDRTEELAGRQYRNLLHRGDDDRSVANRVYTHSDATRFRRRLLLADGRTCADVMPWAAMR